ncbi:MAG TPA: PfkB family carbohydrate kinase, partial [Emcibacteraceae bacterium]|nr:PfkB family carbohydrate kinase [Emcibacteraceae bacterium]
MTKRKPDYNDPYIAVIGGANMDICGASMAALSMHDSNPGKVTISPGGVGRNIAENLSLLGVSCQFFSAVGDDIFGDQLIKEGEKSGIDMSGVLRIAGMRTSTYLAVLDEQGDMAVSINDMEIVGEITPDYIDIHHENIKKAA